MSINDVPVVHPSDESKVPGRIIGRKDVKVFSFKTYLVEERFGNDSLRRERQEVFGQDDCRAEVSRIGEGIHSELQRNLVQGKKVRPLPYN